MRIQFIFLTTESIMPPLLHPIVESHDDYTNNPTKKSVRFIDDVTICPVDEVETSEKASYWLQQEEFLNIRKECIEVIRAFLDPNKILKAEFRGLEKKTPIGAQRRNEHREEARRIVLEEQQYQSYYGTPDADLIATLYSTVTHRCRAEAHMTGIRDEIAAREDTTMLAEVDKNKESQVLEQKVSKWNLFNSRRSRAV